MDSRDSRELTRIADALERIAVALERFEPADDTPAPTTGECEHPIEARIDFGVTNGQPDWQCGRCGFRTAAPVDVDMVT